MPLEELIPRYLRELLDDPRGPRLSAWRGLADDDGPAEEHQDLSDFERRREEGELAADLDPEAVMLFLLGAVSTPVVMPHAVRAVFGLDPQSPEFRERYAEQLRRLCRHLA